MRFRNILYVLRYY